MSLSLVGQTINRLIPPVVSALVVGQLNSSIVPMSTVFALAVLNTNKVSNSLISLGLSAAAVCLRESSPYNLTLLALSTGHLSYTIIKSCQNGSKPSLPLAVNEVEEDTSKLIVGSQKKHKSYTHEEIANYIKNKLKSGAIVLDTSPNRQNWFKGMQIRNLSYDNLAYHVNTVGLFEIGVPTTQGFLDAYQAIRSYYERDIETWDLASNDRLTINYVFLSKIFGDDPKYSN